MSTLQLELSPLSDLLEVIGEVIQDENLTQHSADILSAKACILRIAKKQTSTFILLLRYLTELRRNLFY